MLPRSRRYCCIIGVSASRIISELNHAARIASLEYELAKIPCLPDCVCLQSSARFYVFLCSSIQQVAIRIWLSSRLCSSFGSHACAKESASSSRRRGLAGGDLGH